MTKRWRLKRRARPITIHKDFWLGICRAGHKSGYGWGIALGIVGRCSCRKWIDKLVRTDASGIREVSRRTRKVNRGK